MSVLSAQVLLCGALKGLCFFLRKTAFVFVSPLATTNSLSNPRPLFPSLFVSVSLFSPFSFSQSRKVPNPKPNHRSLPPKK